jgi:CRP/FNR family cyclic AMP-dependent transcriptional regulator
MRTLEPILAEHPFLRDLDPKYIQLLTGCASNVRFEAGQFIFREGEAANQFYIVRHGQVALESYNPALGAVTILTLGEGDVLGWSWLILPYKWMFDARALTLTRAIAFDAECLRAKCESDHDLGYELMKRVTQIIAQRLQATRLQLMDIYGTPV